MVAILWMTFSNSLWTTFWTHYSISIQVSIGSDNGSSPKIIWTNDGPVHSSPGLYELLWYTHYNDVIMSTMASLITSITIVYSIFHSGAVQRKHQSSASMAFAWAKGPVTRKMLPFDDVIMKETNMYFGIIMTLTAWNKQARVSHEEGFKPHWSSKLQVRSERAIIYIYSSSEQSSR